MHKLPEAAPPVIKRAATVAAKRTIPIQVVVKEDAPARERNSDGVSYAETVARYKAKVRNPLTAIRANCVECSGGSLKEVAECPVKKCALYPFRMGVNPLHKKARDRMSAQAEGGEESEE